MRVVSLDHMMVVRIYGGAGHGHHGRVVVREFPMSHCKVTHFPCGHQAHLILVGVFDCYE